MKVEGVWLQSGDPTPQVELTEANTEGAKYAEINAPQESP